MKLYPLAIALTVFLSACVQVLPVQISPETGFCTSRDESEINIETTDSTLTLSGSIITSPCNTLEAKANMFGNDVRINIKINQYRGACIECMGEVPFNGSLQLPDGSYRVVLSIDNEPFAEKFVSIGK